MQLTGDKPAEPSPDYQEPVIILGAGGAIRLVRCKFLSFQGKIVTRHSIKQNSCKFGGGNCKIVETSVQIGRSLQLFRRGGATTLSNAEDTISSAIDWINGVPPKTISFCRTPLGDSNIERLTASLRGNTSVTSLNLAQTHMGTDGAKAVAELLRANGTIQNLNISVNSLSPEAISTVLDAARESRSLKWLAIECNSMEKATLRKVAKLRKERPELTIAIDLIGEKLIEQMSQSRCR